MANPWVSWLALLQRDPGSHGFSPGFETSMGMNTLGIAITMGWTKQTWHTGDWTNIIYCQHLINVYKPLTHFCINHGEFCWMWTEVWRHRWASSRDFPQGLTWGVLSNDNENCSSRGGNNQPFLCSFFVWWCWYILYIYYVYYIYTIYILHIYYIYTIYTTIYIVYIYYIYYLYTIYIYYIYIPILYTNTIYIQYIYVYNYVCICIYMYMYMYMYLYLYVYVGFPSDEGNPKSSKSLEKNLGLKRSHGDTRRASLPDFHVCPAGVQTLRLCHGDAWREDGDVAIFWGWDGQDYWPIIGKYHSIYVVYIYWYILSPKEITCFKKSLEWYFMTQKELLLNQRKQQKGRTSGDMQQFDEVWGVDCRC